MIRVLVFLLLLGLVALGIGWMADQPGDIAVRWLGYDVQTSIGVGVGLLVAVALALNVVWAILRFIFRIPSLMSLAAKARRRTKGFAALSRGMIAAGAGDARTARKSAAEAKRHLNDEPLALLLSAQAAQLSGDRTRAEAAFGQLAERHDTRLLGLRGLHVEAQRRGDHEAAHHFAHEAHAIAPLPWSAKAVLDHRAARGHWEHALAALESHIQAKLVDKKTGERQRAVLETAIALDKSAAGPDEALKYAQAALKRAPDLVPALALAARLTARKGDLRKAAKIIEHAWPRCPHPDLAAVYVDLRPGDSNFDRLAKAQTLMRLAPRQPESRLALARAALGARRFDIARDAMAPLVAEGERPTAGMCLIMAEIENAEHGDQGKVRQWMARAARATRDAVWMADGVASASWAPASPVNGRLDAYVWQIPPERSGAEIAHEPQPDWTLEWVQGGELPAARQIELAPPAEPAEEPAPAPEAEGTADEAPATAPAAADASLGKLPEQSAPAKEEAPAKEPAPAAIIAQPPQKVVFPMPTAPDDPGLEDVNPPPKRRAGFF
jgi:HemY protein